jgi:membrane-associated phospholipid phosphatase
VTPRNEKGLQTPLIIRFFWLALLVFLQMLYFPINRLASGGVSLSITLDQYVPFWPIWAVPYLLSLAWWEGCFIWAAIKVAPKTFRAFVIAAASVMVASYVIYLFFPTYVERPTPAGTGWGIELVRLIYVSDRSYNAFPSGHAYTTTMISLFLAKWYPSKRWLWSIIAFVIILSALFTGQHNLLDMLGGVLLASGGYILGVWLDSR